MPNTYTPKLNLPLIGTGDTGWKIAGDACTDMIDTLGGLQSFSVAYAGVAVLNKVFGRRTFDSDVTIKKIEINSDDKPTGPDANSDIKIDVVLDDAEQTRMATLAANTEYQATTLTPLNVTNMQVFGLKFKQIGATFKGGEFYITVHYQPKAIATI